MEALFVEISTWALAMPSYSSPLCGIATTVLTLLHDRCDGAARALLQQAAPVQALLDRSTVVESLESEPGLRFVEDEELFADPYKEVTPAASDAVLAAALAARAPAGDTTGQARLLRFAAGAAGHL